jgi:signal transduction histidine kinase
MKRHKILIVDDEEKNIKLLKAMLMTENYQCFWAFNGNEALETVNEIEPDLILLDIMMPGIDGYEVCSRLKRNEKTRMIPIIMVTALIGKEDHIYSINSGADDFISKPVDRTELLTRVKSMVRIKSYQDDLVESHRELAEKNLKLKELEKIKEELTHMIIHDLNSRLSVIKAGLELVQMDKENISEDNLQIIRDCFSSCSEMILMIRSILDIHMMEAGKLNLDKKMMQMEELINDLLLKFKNKTSMEQISLSFSGNGNIPSIKADVSLIKRVLSNLINNSIRHTSKGGKIEVGVDSLSEEGNICVSVKDNGDGLAPKHHKKIFEKFEQVTLKQTGTKLGTSGLGLNFCKLAIEAHGGRIWVESKGKGMGCTFSFTLPV